MTDAQERRQRWEPALRAWNGAEDALDGAVARTMTGVQMEDRFGPERAP